MLGHTTDGGFVADSMQTGISTVPRLSDDQLGLLGAGAGGQWLADNLHTGDTVGITTQLAPDNDVTQLVSGVDTLVKDGKVYKDPTGTPPSGANPETAVGITQDGKHAIVVAVDGHGGASTAFGVTRDQAAGYMVAHGAYTAMLFDGGGSTGMVSRAPGADQAEVVNTPSDLPGNTERPVANGIFFYSTAKEAGAADKVVVNGGKTVTTVANGSIPLPVHSVDRFANPAAGQVHVRIVPSSLATYEDGKLTPHRTGTGRIIAFNGKASTSEKLEVVSKLESLTVSPDKADLDGGATQQLTLSGTVKDGGTVQIPAEAATWKVTPDSLGSVDAHGLFTANADNGGLAEVSAQVAGTTGTTSIAVGSVSKVIDPMTNLDVWRLSNNTTGKPATLTTDPGVVPPGSAESGSLRLDYSMPAGSGVKQLVLSPRVTLKTETNNGQVPTAIGVWIKGDGNGLELAEKYIGVNGSSTTLYPTYVTWKDWHLAVAQLPAGMQFPLTISFIDFLAISPSTAYSGSLNVAGLQALYSPRPVTAPEYDAIPQNPKWLSFEEDSADFAKRGTTILTGDDAHMLASDPGSVSSNVMDSIAKRLPTLTPQARPDAAQFLGDMSDDGKLADLQYAKSKMDALGIPKRDIVGNHEITQAPTPRTATTATPSVTPTTPTTRRGTADRHRQLARQPAVLGPVPKPGGHPVPLADPAVDGHHRQGRAGHHPHARVRPAPGREQPVHGPLGGTDVPAAGAALPGDAPEAARDHDVRSRPRLRRAGPRPRGPEHDRRRGRHPAVHLRGPRHAGLRPGRPGWHLPLRSDPDRRRR